MQGNNCHGRTFNVGCPLGNDYRFAIVQALMSHGSNTSSGAVPRGTYVKVSKQFLVTPATVRNIWYLYVQHGTVSPIKKGRPPGSGLKLTEEDTVYVKQLVTLTPTIYRSEIRDKLVENSNNISNASEISISTICRTVRHRLSDKVWTRKRTKRSNVSRWTHPNIVYTRNFISFVQSLPSETLRFCDEASFCCSHSGCRFYGSSAKGVPALDISKHNVGPSYTLFLMIGLGGVQFAKVESGTSTGYDFTMFIYDSVNSAQSDGTLTVPPGSTIIADNAPIHRFSTAKTIKDYLAPLNITYTFLPKFSPDLNPCEAAYLALREALRHDPYRHLAADDVKTAVLYALQTISAHDIREFFKNVSNNYMRL